MADSSKFLAFYRKILLNSKACQEFLNRVYRDSRTFLVFEKPLQKMKVYFKFSFLGRLTAARTQETTMILDESSVLKFLNRNFIWLKKSISDCISESLILKSFKEFSAGFYVAPIKTVSRVMVLLILLNIVFLLFLQKEIALLGWVFRFCFLIIGLIGLAYKMKWQDLEKTSFILRKLDEKN